MSEDENSPPRKPTSPLITDETKSPGRVTPTLTDVVTQVTVQALKEYAEIDSAVEAAKDPAVKEKESATRARRLIDPKLLEKAKTYTPEIEPEDLRDRKEERSPEGTRPGSAESEHILTESLPEQLDIERAPSEKRVSVSRPKRRKKSYAGSSRDVSRTEVRSRGSIVLPRKERSESRDRPDSAMDRAETAPAEEQEAPSPRSPRSPRLSRSGRASPLSGLRRVSGHASAISRPGSAVARHATLPSGRASVASGRESVASERASVASERASVASRQAGAISRQGTDQAVAEASSVTDAVAGASSVTDAVAEASSVTDGRLITDGHTPPPRQPAKPTRKTKIDDESSSSESEVSSVESADTSSDEGGEMVVLDPDHPLMTRFQNALNRHLVKQMTKINLEVNELDFLLKSKQREREDVGVDLYGVQQELARNQMTVEQLHDEFAKLQKERIQGEQELKEIREAYTKKHKLIKMERKKAADLLAEVENLALRLYYMESAKNDVRSDIAVMKRAAEKAEMEVARSEMEKQKQDIYVNRLVERVDKLQETIAMFDAQITAQCEETKAAEDALGEARVEIEAITLEKKQLFHQWNCSLIGMRRRDEARAAMQEALDQEHQRIISLETEIEGYKRSTQKEQEQNEKLTMILNKAENDIATIRKQMAMCQPKLDALKNEYATYTRMMQETEQSLNKANADKAMWVQEQTAVRKQLEQQYAEKVKLEDDILQKMHDQLTIDKAAKYTFKLMKQLRQKTKATATNIARIENDISNDTLEGSNLRARIERLMETIMEYEEEIHMKNEIVSRCFNETIKRNATIERKQGVIDQLNKKIDQLLSQSGGVELGPLEVTINSLQKSIMAEHEETTELQNMWLRNQHELVQLTKEQDSQQCDINNIKKQLTILQQRKLRTEGEIEMEKAEALEQERDIGSIEKEMMRLNVLLYKKRGLHHELEQSNSLMEGDFIGSLKEAERESIELQEKLNGLQEEKERLLNSLVEAERQIMLWEKKTQLARETRAAVDSDIGEGEIKAMKAEIHRMQVRHGQLLKTQERMIQDMEKAVSRRDTIVTRGEARAKLNQKVVTKGKFQRQLAELRKKIKNAISEANSCDDEIENLRSDQSEMSRHLEEKQLEVQQQQSTADMLDGDTEQRMEEKHKNLLNLVQRQQKAKFYQQIKDGKYVRVCRTDSARQTERARQEERMQSTLAIVNRLTNDLPNLHPALQRVTYVYGNGPAVGSQDSLVSPTTSH